MLAGVFSVIETSGFQEIQYTGYQQYQLLHEIHVDRINSFYAILM